MHKSHKCAANNLQKRKQSFIFDFFSTTPKKLQKQQSDPFESKQQKNLKIEKTTCSSFSMNEDPADGALQTSKLLESLNNTERFHHEIASNSVPACCGAIDSGCEVMQLNHSLMDMPIIQAKGDVDNTKHKEGGKVDNGSPLICNSESLTSTLDAITSQDLLSSPSCQSVEFGCSFETLPRMRDCGFLLPELTSSANHTILFELYSNATNPTYSKGCSYCDAWDSKHVRLPCSSRNLYPVKTNSFSINSEMLEKRWELIQSSLMGCISNSVELEKAILTYNSRYADQWSFCALHKFFINDVDQDYCENFFKKILPGMVQLALMLPTLIPEPIPLLIRQKSYMLTMTQQQIACLLCNAFFCTFPRRNTRKSISEYSNYPDINFNRLFSVSSTVDTVITEKLKFLIHYFERVTTNTPCGTVSFERRSLNEFPKWNQSPCCVSSFHIRSEGTIEKEGSGMLQVDFANRYIGGGVLGLGAVQEEIRFCVCPELIVTRLFCEALDNNECIVVTGIEQFSLYTGYGSSLKWAGEYYDVTPFDEWRRRRTQIVAMDAKYFFNSNDQFQPSNICRELNKAFCGFFCDFDPDHAPAVATGNWGCGAFRGNPMLKALIQILAAAALGRTICYFTFNDTSLAEKIYEMYMFLKNNDLEIRHVWNMLTQYNNDIIRTDANEELFEYMKRIYKEYNESTDESDD